MKKSLLSPHHKLPKRVNCSEPLIIATFHHHRPVPLLLRLSLLILSSRDPGFTLMNTITTRYLVISGCSFTSFTDLNIKSAQLKSKSKSRSHNQLQYPIWHQISNMLHGKALEKQLSDIRHILAKESSNEPSAMVHVEQTDAKWGRQKWDAAEEERFMWAHGW